MQSTIKNDGPDPGLVSDSLECFPVVKSRKLGDTFSPSLKGKEENSEDSFLVVELLKSCSSAWRDSIKKSCRKTSEP